MSWLADYAPKVAWGLAAAVHVALIIKRGLQKEPLPMSEALPIETAGADTAAAQVQATAPAAVAGAASVNFHPVATTVVQAVQSTMAPESNWATTAATVLQGLMPTIQAGEQVSSASVKTQGEVAIGVSALAALLTLFFPHPAAQAA